LDVIGEKLENFAQKSGFDAIFRLQTHLFYQICSLKPNCNDLLKQVAQLAHLEELLDVKKALNRPFGGAI